MGAPRSNKVINDVSVPRQIKKWHSLFAQRASGAIATVDLKCSVPFERLSTTKTRRFLLEVELEVSEADACLFVKPIGRDFFEIAASILATRARASAKAKQKVHKEGMRSIARWQANHKAEQKVTAKTAASTPGKSKTKTKRRRSAA